MDKIQELRKKLIGSAKKKVQEKYEEKDIHIIKAVNILDDLDSITNLLTEQLIEWHSTNFPELNNLVKGEKYYELVYKIGEAKKFDTKTVDAILEDKDLTKEVVQTAKKTMGSKTGEEELAEMQTLALNCRNLEQEREYLASFIEKNMKKEMPNFTEIAGAIIGAKIMAQAGGKKKLAFLPASAIQVIGAEKALFLHFRKGIKGPKYGYLFQHPLIKAAKKENKGRLARSLASKLAIAIRKDYFGNTSSAKDLEKDIQERAKELGERKEPEKKGKPSTQRFENKRRTEKAMEMNEKERGFGKRDFGNKREGRSFGDRKENRNYNQKREGNRSFGAKRETRGPRDREDSRAFGKKPFKRNDDKPKYGNRDNKPKYGDRKNDRPKREPRNFGRQTFKKNDDSTNNQRERSNYMGDMKKYTQNKPKLSGGKHNTDNKSFSGKAKPKRGGKSKKEFTHWKKNRKK